MRGRVLSKIKEFEVFTLFSFWNKEASTWCYAEELGATGFATRLANEVKFHLRNSLAGAVTAAMQQRWTPEKGQCVLDAWCRDGTVIYDSILRIAEVSEDRGWVRGDEFEGVDGAADAGQLRRMIDSPTCSKSN